MRIIGNKYEIREKLGEGNFGAVYEGINIHTNNPVAIKMEPIGSPMKLLKNETKKYHYFGKMQGIPELKWFGMDNMYYCMVITLLGRSLTQFIREKTKIPLHMVCQIGIQMVTILERIHQKGFVHRDVKPDNFLFGREKAGEIHLVDFGFCKGFVKKDGTHIDFKNDKTPLGTLNYVSINVHEGCEPSRRDDMEALIYIMLFMIKGNLPWNELNKDSDYRNINFFIKENKNFFMEKGDIPSILREMWYDCRSWTFEKKPNYEKWTEMLRGVKKN